MRGILKVIYFLFAVFLFVFVAVILYTQTQPFKDYLRDEILKASQKSINGELKFASIGGNLLVGFSFDTVIIVDDSGEQFIAQRIVVKFDPFGLIFKRIVFSEVGIVQPEINIYRSAEGFWNVARLFKVDREDTTKNAWNIVVKNLEIENARIKFVDSLRLYRRAKGELPFPPTNRVDYANISLGSFSLKAYLEIRPDFYFVKIGKLGFTSDSVWFKLADLSGEFSLAKNRVLAKDVKIETGKSRLKLDVVLEDIDILHISNIRDLKLKPVEVFLIADVIDTRELKKFLYPWVDFLDKELSLQLKAYGTFESLNIEQLIIQMPHTFAQFKGRLNNLHNPSNLEIYVDSDQSYLNAVEVVEHLPGLELPDLHFLGNVKYALKYEGRPLDFKASLDANTDVGEIVLEGSMKIDSKGSAYSANITTHKLDIGSIVNSENLKSDLNSSITIKGSGFDLKTMTTLARIEIDSSLFNGIPVHNSVIVFDVADGTMRSHSSTSISNTKCDYAFRLSFMESDSVDYNLKGKIRSLDLSEILKTEMYKSALSFDFNVTGYSRNGNRNDTARIHFLPSRFEGEYFESAEAEIAFNMHDSINTVLRLNSTIGGFILEGKYTPTSFYSALLNSYKLVRELINEKMNLVTGYKSESNKIQEALTIPNFQARYRLSFDLKPVGVLINENLNGYLFAEGSFNGNSNTTHMDGTIKADQLEMQTGLNYLCAEQILLNYNLDGINQDSIESKFIGIIKPEFKNFRLNKVKFDRLAGNLIVGANGCNFDFSTSIDSTYFVETKGIANVKNNLLNFEIPVMNFGLNNEFVLKNSDTINVLLDKNGLFFKSFVMKKDNEQVSITGSYKPKGFSDLSINLTSFRLNNINTLYQNYVFNRISSEVNGVLDAYISLKGKYDDPEVKANLQVHEMSTGAANDLRSLGRIDADFSYYKNRLNIFLKHTNEDENKVFIKGSLPYSLARDEQDGLKGAVDLLIQANGLDLKLLELFIPEVSNLTGKLFCDWQVKGTVDDPLYDGYISIKNASFVFEPVGLSYNLNAYFVPSGNNIELKQVTLQNYAEQGGKVELKGYFTLRGLSLDHFDILMLGDLRIMKSDRRLKGQKFYGDLFVETSEQGLKWIGDLKSSTLGGKLFIKEAYMVFPPEKETETVKTTKVNRVFKDDTSRTSVLSPDFLVNGKNWTPTRKNGSLKIKGNYLAHKNIAPQNSFLSSINYDLSIEAKGPTQLRFVFNTQTSEELFVDLQGSLYYNKTRDQSRLSGQVEVGSNSYYNFIKKFEATGKLQYTGDILNPELDIIATYQGIHRITPADTMQATSGETYEKSIKEEQVLITLHITGTRNEPKTKLTLATKGVNDKEWLDWEKGDDEANAISFIVSGQFRDELTERQRMGFVSTHLGFALASGMVTGPLSEILRKHTFIKSVDVLYSGGQFDETADIRLTGQYKSMVIRAGGRILNDIGNTNVSIEMPMSTLVNSDKLRNLILTLERRVEGVQSLEEQRRASNGLRLFYRITF